MTHATQAIDLLAKLGSAAFGLLFLWEGGQVAYGLVRRKL
jgi:hypothetical protein